MPPSDLPALLPVLQRIAESLERLASNAPAPWADPADPRHERFIWRGEKSGLHALGGPSENGVSGALPLSLLCGLEGQKKQLLQNTRLFARGQRGNHALLWGARGMGKSSLVRSLVDQVNEEIRAGSLAASGTLALVEVSRSGLGALHALLDRLSNVRRQMILFLDDLSFESEDEDYKSLKSLLDGGLAGCPDNVLLYATSNRRHLMPRSRIEGDEIAELPAGLQGSETVEERISLSDRFGLWLGVHGARQEDYLRIVHAHAQHRGLELPAAELEKLALAWSLARGARSGRVAAQFITALAAEQAGT
ncbi:ATP-binding protein [Oecophyllibacter saccharovorans]|uniref:ATP-binding protein n=1 Tax=Oecophyllibacter saccharovorans TaxID=2558360 RepID=UPI00117438B4|nr:ATP-binding protein [Oecophyllibacter saccharovorans]TPW36670.1 ATP-binding protein [Oecophyllibacter saccharovorans]